MGAAFDANDAHFWPPTILLTTTDLPALLLCLCILASDLACAKPIVWAEKTSTGETDEAYSQELSSQNTEVVKQEPYSGATYAFTFVAVMMLAVRGFCKIASSKPDCRPQFGPKPKPRVAIADDAKQEAPSMGACIADAEPIAKREESRPPAPGVHC